LAGQIGPDRIIGALAQASGTLGDVAPHYFSFGGTVATARYAHDKVADLGSREPHKAVL
jgi:hypothetical protein